jgi:8-oxo-dGTP pyrophosphatase MutT (NUDIX family)
VWTLKPIGNSAKAVIVENGRVLLTKNVDHLGHYYLFPGGGQEKGEDLRSALVRECLEETGCRVEVGDLVYIREYIGKNHEFAEWDRDVHQVEFYFACRIEGPERELEGSNPDSFQVDVEWNECHRLDEIRLYPREACRGDQIQSGRPGLSWRRQLRKRERQEGKSIR